MVIDATWVLLMPHLVHFDLEKNEKMELNDSMWKSEEVDSHCTS